MKRFVLSLALALFLVGWGWQGYRDFGTAPAYGQPPPPPPRAYTCDPYYPYRCYYTAPYADPYSQYFYYVEPDVQEEILQRREERLERRERQERRREWEREHGFR